MVCAWIQVYTQLPQICMVLSNLSNAAVLCGTAILCSPATAATSRICTVPEKSFLLSLGMLGTWNPQYDESGDSEGTSHEKQFITVYFLCYLAKACTISWSPMDRHGGHSLQMWNITEHKLNAIVWGWTKKQARLSCVQKLSGNWI